MNCYQNFNGSALPDMVALRNSGMQEIELGSISLLVEAQTGPELTLLDAHI